jgi:hypothetical protein
MALFTFGLAVRLALTLPWTDSEIWIVSAFSLGPIRFGDLNDNLKPALAIFFGLLTTGLSLEDAMDRTRLAAALTLPLNLVLATLLLHRFGLRLAISVSLALLIFLHPGLLFQGTSSRSDVFLQPLILGLALSLLTNRILISNIILSLTFLTTPKSILTLLPMIWIASPRILGLGAAVLVASLVTFWPSFSGGLKVGLEIMTQGPWLMGRFDYVWAWTSGSPVHALILLASAGAAALLPAGGDKSSLAFRRAGLCLLLVLIVFPERLPFFVTTTLSTSQIFLFCGLAPAFRRIQGVGDGLVHAGSFSLIVLTIWTTWTAEQRVAASFQPLQREALARIRDYSRIHPEVSIYDPIGLTHRLDMSNHFIGPGEAENSRRLVEVLDRERFDLVLVTEKLELLIPYLLPEIRERFLIWPEGVMTRGFRIPTAGENQVAVASLVDRLETHWPPAFQAQAEVRLQAFDGAGQDARSRVVLSGKTRRHRGDAGPVSLIDFLRDFERIELDGETVELGFTLIPSLPAGKRAYAELFSFPKGSL